MEKPKATQLDLFDQEGNPIIPSTKNNEGKEQPTVEERKEWKEEDGDGEDDGYEYDWQRIHNR